MARKIISLLLTLMLVVSCAAFTASAADNEVYVEAGATGGNGSDDKPFGSLEEAITALGGKAGTVYIYGEYDLATFTRGFSWTEMVTIKGASADSKLTLKDNGRVYFEGPLTFKDISFDFGKYAHMNPIAGPFIFDAGDDATLGNTGIIHFPAFENRLVEGDAYFEFNSGVVSQIYVAGGYNTTYSNGVMGDSTFVMNGGKTTLSLYADFFKDEHTGISVGGNLNVVINGGEVVAIRNSEARQPEIMGALNIIFNNGMEAPEKFVYPETAVMGTYIIFSDKGGTVMPTADPGVFEIKADAGKVAVIDGKQVFDGKVTLDAGETEVTWVAGEQPEKADDAIEIKLVIGSAELVKNGEKTALDVPAQIIDDRTMVPLRAIFEALGASVEWDDATKTVTSVKDDTTVKLTIGENKLTVNGEAKTLDVPGQIVESRTLVPARAIAESFGCDVAWDAPSKTVTITK